jgi:VWFA-related protein
MHHFPRRTAALLLAVSCPLTLMPAGPAGATPKEDAPQLPPLVEEIQVEVVNVDVVVTDRQGNPVTGLTRDDFTLYEDGKPRPISNFYSFQNGTIQGSEEAAGPAEAETPGNTEATRRRMVVLFDGNSLEKRDRSRAIDAIERFILEQFDGTYEWAVVAYRDRLQLMQPFTASKTQVLAALSKVRDLPIQVRRLHAWDPLETEDDLTVSRATSFGIRTGFDQVSDQYVTRQEFQTRDRMLALLHQFDATASALIQTMRAYSGLSGRKALVLVTGGLEVVPGASQLLGRGFPGAGSENRTDPFTSVMNAEIERRYEAIVKTANAAGFAIYPVSGGSGADAGTPGLDVDRKVSLVFKGGLDTVPAQIDVDTTPTVLAEGTGGKYFSSTHYYGALDEIDQRTSNAYVLGFQTERAPDGKYHRLKVDVTRPGLNVKSREGYLHISRQARLLEELSTPLAFPKDRGDFPVAIEVLPPESVSAKAITLTVAGTVPLRNVTLVPRGDQMVGRMYVYLAIYDRDGNLVRLFREEQDVALPAAKVAAASPDVPARFGIKVKDMTRGEYTLTLTLMDEISDRYGTGLQPVQL